SGDEFTVLIEDTDPSGAIWVAERILEDLRNPFTLGAHEVFVTASLGVSIGGGRARPAHLLRDADLAMYRAKEGGKGGYEIFDPEMSARALARLRLENEIRQGLANREFEVHYQPKVSLKTGAVTGVEALLRWHHPERGLLLPSEFIGVSEETGLIVPLGRLVLREACRQMRLWQDLYPGERPLVVCVNVSARQLHRPELASEVGRVLEETGLAPESVYLEVTESVAMDEALEISRTLRQLKRLGVRLVLDDFGVGYSSYARLKSLPVDLLKIDRSFSAGLGESPVDREIVAAMIRLARALDISTVAEGVETAEQAARLRELGCDLAQGYHFAEPLPAEAAAAYLERNR
ncbi:MAG: bifunctional diguanylate cyclase/phosphodiesterase, partial [Actinomycetota bacterium]